MDLLKSLPIGLYLEQPVTWLHKLDPRVKIGWLMTFLIAPILANPFWRLGLVILLIFLTLTARIPLRVWRQQMGWLLGLCIFVFIFSCFAPDGMGTNYQPRLPVNDITFAQQPATLPPQKQPEQNSWFKYLEFWKTPPTSNQPATLEPQKLPQPTDYNYILFQQGPAKITRKSLDLSLSFSTLLFTLIYSTNLYLLTTAPEEITAGLESFLAPLKWFNWPVTEIALTLTLSLRFIPLVLEEIQNLIRSVSTRAINWKKLGFKGATQVWLIVAEKLLQNLLLRASQMASAMQVRGFTTPNEHRVQWHQLRLRTGDSFALISLLVLWGFRLIWGWDT
ncbi:CbiQ family ECF transporter T component [Ancylothrix sp. C2]|uniref:energy-coupling factor transporter transmembrane component T family protein n=1 Tax=Ancylothrix sp. D3o TaxID=2953691 RepID=UPI0021BABA93|nr:CbiQ family ECF transporter T component [Ancylothrix sp. D3o]MCT7949910.1 CbiQ family ECF transporter T component [Ancylothrix sp. D3o]